MQVVENWSDVQGDLKQLSPNTSDPTFSLATLKVDSAADVGSFPNFLRQKVGNEITVKIPQAALKEASLPQVITSSYECGKPESIATSAPRPSREVLIHA